MKKMLAALSAAAICVTALPATAFAEDNAWLAPEEYCTVPQLPAECSINDRLETVRQILENEKPEGTFLANSSSSSYIAVMKTYLSYFHGDSSGAKFTAMDSAANEIVAEMDTSMSDLSKIIYVNDYLTTNCEYSMDTLTDPSGSPAFTAYDCLVTGKAVCQGYAEAFWYLMYKLDIDCKIITSSQINHAWNLVMVDNKWYQIDVTWNDPVPDKEGRSRHAYLLQSDSLFKSSTVSGHTTHNASDWTLYYEDKSTGNGYATSTKYDEYFWLDVDVPLIINNNKYYFANSAEKYIGCADASNTITKAVSVSDLTWPVTGKTGYYWVGYYGGLQSYDNRLIYCGPTTVYSCNFDGSDTRTVYELTASDKAKGNIYGISLSGNKLTLLMSDSPNDAISDKITITLSGGGTPTAPAKPVISSTTPGVNSVNVKWSAVSGAKSYRVYYRTSSSGKWAYKATTGTSLTVTGLTGGTKYDFVVRAYNGSAWSPFTNADIVTATPKSGTPAKPVVISATAGTNSATVKWKAVSGATSYRVYYRTSGVGKWSYKNTKATSLTVTGLTGGTKYDFIVRAYNGSAWSPFTNADAVTATPIGKPAFTSVTPREGRAVLRWNAAGGAKLYRVYYRVKGSGKWSYKQNTLTSMNLTGLTSGKTYEFILRASDGSVWTTYTSADIVTADIL